MTLRIRVRDCKYLRHRGKLYNAGEILTIEESEWAVGGIGKMAEIIPASHPLIKAEKKAKVERNTRHTTPAITPKKRVIRRKK